MSFYYNQVQDRLENVTENFSDSSQENHFEVNKVTCDFYLWGSLKDRVYKTNPHALEEIRNSIYH
jgi:hypothetical protein